MGIRDLTFLKLGSLGIFAGLWVSCTSDQGRLIEKDLSGYVIVSTVATAPSTGPGLLSLVSPDGAEVTTIGDFYSSAEFVTGLAYLGDNRIVLSVDGADRINQYNLTTGVMSSFAVNVNVTATPLRQMAITNDKSLFVVESNTNAVEKIDASGSRVGAPFIATTTGSCVLATPYGIAYDPINNQIAVISSPGGGAGRLSIYDASSGACVTHVTAAPLNAGAPVGIAYHSLTQKFIVSFNTTHAIYAFDLDGTNGTQIYLNSSIISSPRALATDTSGAIYVGSDGTDTVEKLSWSGTGSATRALAGPLVGPSINSQNPTSILVIQ